MSELRYGDTVLVDEDAEDLPDELRGKEGVLMSLDPSHIGESFEGADDGARIWRVYFQEMNLNRPIHQFHLTFLRRLS